MNTIQYLTPIISILLAGSSLAYAGDSNQEKRITELEARVAKLEKLYQEKNSEMRWKDAILWSRVSKGMTEDNVRKLLGTPSRIEESIFTTWYYHPTSKLHSHVWFDEGEVLGWEGTEAKHKRRKSLLKP